MGPRDADDAADPTDHGVVDVADALRVEELARVEGTGRVANQVDGVTVAGGGLDEELAQPRGPAGEGSCGERVDADDLEATAEPGELVGEEFLDVVEVFQVAEVSEAKEPRDEVDARDHRRAEAFVCGSRGIIAFGVR
jgi:hypothetical protein